MGIFNSKNISNFNDFKIYIGDNFVGLYDITTEQLALSYKESVKNYELLDDKILYQLAKQIFDEETIYEKKQRYYNITRKNYY